MKKKIIYMFLILQILLIISNYNNINNDILFINYMDLLKIIIFVFNTIYILFVAKNDLGKKIIYFSILFFVYISFLYDKFSISQLICNYYYISSFSFLLFYFINNKINRFFIANISSFSLIILDIALLFNHQESLSIELLITILLSIIFILYNQYKMIVIPIFLLTILISTLNDMNFVLYNSLIFSLLVLISSKNKKELLNSLLIFIPIVLLLVVKNMFSLSSILKAFDAFFIDINFTSFVIMIPLLIILCLIISKLINYKGFSKDTIVITYTSLFIVSLMMISLDKVYNEFVIICLALLLVLLIDRINNNKKKLKKNITFFVLHLGYGGIESSTINTANELSKFYKVNIVSFYNLKRNIENTIDDSIKVTHLYNGEPNKVELKESIKNKNIIGIIKNGIVAVKILFLKQYYNICNMYYCDSKYVVSTRNEYSILLSEYGNKRTIKIAQEHMHHRDNKKYINNIKYKFNNINYLFALTESLKNDYEMFLEKNKTTKVLVVPNIIYLPKKKAKLDNKNFITISRLNSIKKIEDMIEIFNNINNKKSKLYIVGDGDELPKLEKLVDELKLSKRVIFTGYKTKEEMEEYILDSSVFLLTSLSEGLPMVLLESMSYGVPCIAFRTKSGVSDIIDNDVNGFIIEGRNKEKYVEKINELIDNKELLREFSKNSINKSKLFTSKQVIKKWQEVLDNEK